MEEREHEKIHFIVITMAIMSCVLAGCDTSQIDNNGNKLPTRKVITGEISYDTKNKNCLLGYVL